MTAPEANVGAWMIAASIIISALSVVLATFITRREVEKMEREFDRRFKQFEDAMVALTKRVDDGGVVARADDEKVAAKLSKHVSDLYDRIGEVDRSVTALQVETRSTGKQLDALSSKMEIKMDHLAAAIAAIR